MKKIPYNLLIVGFLLLGYSCKKNEDLPNLNIGFYLVDKSTGENLIGEGKPFEPEDVTVFVMYYGDTATKRNYSHATSFHNEREKGYIWNIGVDTGSGRTDYIISLGELEPDTITLKNGYQEDVENIDIYLNGEIQDKIYFNHSRRTPFVKIEKEL